MTKLLRDNYLDIHRYAGNVTLTNSKVSGNMASGNYPQGGGIFNNGGTLTLTNSTVSGNGSNSGFGGGISNAGTLTLTNSTVSGNTATSIAGGIYNRGTLTLTNSTVSGNTASTAGGIVDNGIGTLTLTNSLVANSTGRNCLIIGTITDGGNNFADDTTCGTTPSTLTGLDPVLKDNGGPTMTHALLAGSNAIDAAGACALPEDQRGAGRVGDCDSGAFEFIGCADLVLANDTITTPVTWETCHTARLGPNLWVEGGLVLVAGAQVILENEVHFGQDASVTLGIDPNLQIFSPESLELQGRRSASGAGPPPR